MKIILGQGNPGAEYTATRHNIGWMLLDTLAGDAAFQPRSKFFALIAEVSIAGEKVLLVKPTTFYNETGRTARALLDFYKLESSDLLVIHDDLALPFGAARIREKGSDAGNNGVKSLTAHIGADYWRLRLGIGTELRDIMPDMNFVLSRFSRDEESYILDTLAPLAQTVVEQFCRETLTATSYPSSHEK